MREFTERDNEIVKFISTYQSTYGYSPSVREIGRNLFMSTTAVQRHLCKLVEMGYINVTPKTPRSIVLKIAI